MRKTTTLLLLLAFAAGLVAQVPQLVVPTGHADDITAVAISPDEQYILTGSMDGTAILWNINGKEIHTFRRHTAGIRAVAFLYDGPQKYVLTADGNGNVHQWTLSGEHLLRFDHSPGYRHGANWVSKVAFSPDGKNFCVEARNYLQCTSVLSPDEDLTPSKINRPIFNDGDELSPEEGFSTPNQEPPSFVEGAPHQVSRKNFKLDYEGSTAFLVGSDGKKLRSYKGHSAAVVSVAFSTADAGKQILIGSAEGTVRRWDLAVGGVISHFKGAEQLPVTVAFTPDGESVLTAGPQGPVKRWDLNGALIQIGEAESIPVLSPDGQYTLTGGLGVKMWQREAPQSPVRVFREDVDPFDFGTGPGQALALAFSPDGKSVLATDREAIVRWDTQTGVVIDRFRGHHEQVNSLAVAPTARGGIYVLAGSNDNTAKLWDSANNVAKAEEMSARQWGDPIGGGFIGGEIQTYRGHANDVSAVAFSPATPSDPSGGQFVLTGSRDNTAKIWERDSGKEIATLIALDSIDWVVTTPNGLFDASPGAMNLMHFVVGVEAIDLEQLKERYYDPGLLGKLMGFSQDPLRSVDVFSDLPLYPEMEARLNEDGRQLQVTLTPRSGGIGKLSLFINDKEVLEDANPERAESVDIDLTKFPRDYLPGKANKLTLRAYNAEGWLKSAPLELDYDPPAAARGSSSGGIANPFAAKKPSLYAIVVGTANYAGDQLDLTFADLDADYFSQALRAAAPKLYEERVEVVLLNTDAESKDRQDISDKVSIEKAFVDIASKAKAQDVLVIYFSGHGLNYGTAESSQFYYLTKDIASENLSDPEIRNNYAISSAELTDWIKAIPARKQVMVIDACNSGKVVEDFAASSRDLNSAQIRALDRMKDRTGMFILTGSAADKVSYEAGQYGQGLLTFSLLQGMSGLGDALMPDGRVDVMRLFQHALDEVPGLARGINGIQTPMLAFPTGGASFDIGIVDENVKIPVAQIKPVFIRNVFQDEESFDDVLGLGKALGDYFRSVTVKGAQAELIYVDVNEYENAYSIKGRYTLADEAVTVRARLFKGKAVVGEAFTVTGNKDDVPGLVEDIIERVDGMLKSSGETGR